MYVCMYVCMYRPVPGKVEKEQFGKPGKVWKEPYHEGVDIWNYMKICVF